jgi:uncharacterized protein YxjI
MPEVVSERPALEALDRLGLTDDVYRVKQSLVRNRYTVYDEGGEAVLEGKQKLLKMKEEFPFEHPDGTPAFTVKAQQVFDVAGDYAIVDPETDEPVLVLGKQFTFFHHAWTISDAEGRLLARAESRSTLLDVLRSVSSIFALIPYRYAIEDADGEPIGEIRERFSFRDKYDVAVEDAGEVPRSALLAAAIVIDALEGN